MIGAKELLRLIAFSEFVHVIQMFGPSVPVRWQRKFFSAVPTNIGDTRVSWGCVESGMDACKSGTRP